MKIAVLSDIHGNIPALEAVLEDIALWQPDKVIVNGDIVNRGPYSLEVLRLLQHNLPQARLLSGNHETFVLYAAEHPLSETDPGFDLRRFAQWTANQLGPDILEEIRHWQDHVDLVGLEQGSSFHVTHGSRKGNRDGISLKTPDEELPEKLGTPRDLYVVSHTHKAMLRHFNGSMIVNTGSVGQPLDDDPRSAYGRFTFHAGKWEAQLRRVSYDKQRAEQDFHDSGFLEAGGPITRLIFREHQDNRMYVGPFMRRYLEAIKQGVITVADAVDRYLES